MKRGLILFAMTCALAAPAATNAIADEIHCLLRLYGEVGDGPLTPIPSGSWSADSRSATVTTEVYGAAIRRPMSMISSPYEWTTGSVSLGTTMGESQTKVQLRLNYVHAMEKDGAGNPKRAVQRVFLSGYAIKVKPGSGGSSSAMLIPSDPFDPSTGFTSVNIVDGVPLAIINETAFLETPTASGVLKVSCTNMPTPILPPPPPVP